MSELSQPTKRLISNYLTWYQFLKPREGIALIHVDEVASRVAAFYEKFRGVLDWREEHLLRKTAIERILKRRLLLKGDGKEIASPLVCELIRGGHFPNDAVEESKIEDVQRLIDKYLFIIANVPSSTPENFKIQLYDWILGIAACELEETLQPPQKERALMEYMAGVMRERIEVREGIFTVGGMAEEEKNTQVYIAVQRSLFKLDPSIISYHLLKKRYPGWSNLGQAALEEIAKNIYSVWEEIKKGLNHPLAEKFYRICEKYDTVYLILGDIIAKNPGPEGLGELENPENLEKKIKEAYQTRLLKVKSKIRRAAIFSTISILLTKMFVAFLLEVPFDKYVTGQFSYYTMGLNILIPSFLMFFLVVTIRPPSKQNLQRVVIESMKVFYESEKQDIYEIKVPRKRKLGSGVVIFLFYLLTFIVSFGLIIWGLRKLHFSILSQVIFIGFVSLIFFAGIKIRERSKELMVEDEKAGFLSVFLDPLFMPLIQVGRWLSSQLEKYNILVVIFNSIIDLPFQIFVEFLEQWREFMKEKKEQIH